MNRLVLVSKADVIDSGSNLLRIRQINGNATAAAAARTAVSSIMYGTCIMHYIRHERCVNVSQVSIFSSNQLYSLILQMTSNIMLGTLSCG